MSASNRWGVRSHDTGHAYMLAYTQHGAELLQAATGRPDVFEVVQEVGNELVVHPTSPCAPPIPEFAVQPVDFPGEDEEIVRLVIVMSDPLYGVTLPPMKVTGAELRERASHKVGSRIIAACFRRLNRNRK